MNIFSAVAGKLDMMRVRATDPRPCPKCGKIYRSAHTLRTHMEDKHTVRSLSMSIGFNTSNLKSVTNCSTGVIGLCDYHGSLPKQS